MKIDKKIKEVVSSLIDNRENTLSIKTQTIMLIPNSLGNPTIKVGTLPYYDWDKDKRITFIIVYGRYISCEMLVYEKLLKDIEHFKTQDLEEARKYITELIISKIPKK